MNVFVNIQTINFSVAIQYATKTERKKKSVFDALFMLKHILTPSVGFFHSTIKNFNEFR